MIKLASHFNRHHHSYQSLPASFWICSNLVLVLKLAFVLASGFRDLEKVLGIRRHLPGFSGRNFFAVQLRRLAELFAGLINCSPPEVVFA